MEAPVSMIHVLVTGYLRFIISISCITLNLLANRFGCFKIVGDLVFLFGRISLQFLPSSVVSLIPNQSKSYVNYDLWKLFTYQNDDGGGGAVFNSCDSGVRRGLRQVLCLVNETPMSSRKYDSVRTLAEKLIRENLEHGSEDLVKINRDVLSMAFRSTLRQLESTITPERRRGFGLGFLNGVVSNGTLNFPIPIVSTFLNTYLRCVRIVISIWKSKEDPTKSLKFVEKFASELLWLAEVMADCRCGEVAFHMWASASNLACLSLKTEPQVQGFLVRIAFFLLKKTRELEREMEKDMERENSLDMDEMKSKMLISWMPLLCQGIVGTDSQLQSISERKEMEKVLGDLIYSLENKEDQENVLSLWLRHYTSSPHSDWPNLHDCYSSWYAASRPNMVMKATTY